MYQKNLNNVSTISKDSLNKRTIQFSSNLKKMIQWIKLQAKLKSSCKSKEKVKCTISTFSTSIIFEYQDVMYCLPVQEDPVHASSSTPSPEHSNVAHVRLLVFLPFFNDHALHGTHSPYSVKNCFSNWENNQL